MSDWIVEFIEAQLAIDEQIARNAPDGPWEAQTEAWPESPEARVWAESATGREVQVAETIGVLAAAHIARHDSARALAVVAFMRRIVELHTTGVYRTYQCGNGDHIQEWQCERANEPYTEHRYCEVCGNECIEVPLLAEIWADQPGYKPEWRVS